MHWRTKAKVFRLLSAIPFGSHTHYFLQRHVTKTLPRSAASAADIAARARDLKARIEAEQRFDFGTGRYLEIGAGRDFAMAVALRLLGSGPITCVDVTRMAKPFLIQAAAERVAAALGMPAPALGSWSQIEAFGITYLAPTTLQASPIQPATIDCFYSVVTLEHIPPADLLDVLVHSRKLLKPTGVSLHYIDYTDHYRAPELSLFNFLTFDEEDWKPYNSDFQYVNRLRHSEHLQLFAQAGLRVVSDEPNRAPIEPQIVAKLAPQFRQFDPVDLFTSGSTIMATPS